MTGYAGTLLEKNLSFPEFALLCARDFGALVMMRDDPMDAPIPEGFKPSQHYANALDKARAEINRLESMSDSERQKFGAARQADAIRRLEESSRDTQSKNQRLRQILNEVRAWNPPTPDHSELKKFMDDQLSISIDRDRAAEEIEKVKKREPMYFFYESLASERRSIEYYEKEHAAELERTRSRNEWVRALRQSLQPAPTEAR